MCEKRSDDAGEDIACACGGECGVAGGVGVDGFPIGDDGVLAFENDGGVGGLCEFSCGLWALVR